MTANISSNDCINFTDLNPARTGFDAEITLYSYPEKTKTTRKSNTISSFDKVRKVKDLRAVFTGSIGSKDALKRGRKKNRGKGS